jgi:glycosyltransferase 2 family protein
MKKIINVFLYGSLIALLIYVYNLDFLIFRDLSINYFWLFISIFLLFTGFILSAISWKVALKMHGIDITSRKAIMSHGLPAFTKYIPGKIWTILGRAALIQSKDHTVKKLSFISLKEQLIYLSLGFIISIYPIVRTEKIREYSFIIISISVLLFILLFSEHLQKLFQRIWNYIFKKEINIPIIKGREFVKLSWFILFYWSVWTLGFYFLLISVLGIVPLYYAFAFPLSVSLGLISIIFPGGIGVREGVIVLFLVANGIQTEVAVTFSVLSRLWFLLGEVFIFLTAVVIRKKG